MTPRAQERSAFFTWRGLYQFKRKPFGLCNAPVTFCRLMHRVLRDHLWRICLCYLDDVIVYATSQQELLERLHTIFSCIHNVGLKVKPSKCSLFKERISFLGQMVSAQGKSSRYRTGQCAHSLDSRPTTVSLSKTLPASRNHFRH